MLIFDIMSRNGKVADGITRMGNYLNQVFWEFFATKPQ